MRKFLLGLIVCLLVSFSIVAYGLSSNLDFQSSQIIRINGKSNKYAVINYNGNVYVPIRFVAENAGLGIQYQDSTNTINIKPSSVKFDEVISAPVPSVAYERKYQNGTMWMQEIPLLQGSSCWHGCIEEPRPLSEFIKQTEYPPVGMKPESNIRIKYPKGLDPKKLEVTIATKLGDAQEEVNKEINIFDDRLHVPKEPGLYYILISSSWNEGYTSYVFAVEIQ